MSDKPENETKPNEAELETKATKDEAEQKSTSTKKEVTTKKATTKKATAKKTTKKATTKKVAKKPRAKKATGKSLVIVESPGKIKTISKLLGEGYIVAASFGHVRDLPAKELGVDIEDNFTPKYVILRDKTKVIKTLKAHAKKCDKLYLAPDLDREGEAIAFHLKESLDFAPEDTFRVTFSEITKKGIAEGFANAHKINDNLVNAQQARRILDRIVGYKLSPLLWKKVAKGLSGGRVQSVAVRVVCEREDEIAQFIKEEYWKVTANVAVNQDSEDFDAHLITWDNKDFEAHDEETINGIVSKLEGQPYMVTNIEKKGQKNRPSPPFITSTLQQAASTQLRYSAKNTMRIAQQLYEGVELKHEGSVSLITYMRTDSFNLSDEAKEAAKEYIIKNLSEEYYPEEPNVFKSKKNAQEAHEAIRPTDALITPDAIKDQITPDQFKLYNLIWRRFIASQMAPSRVAITNAEITAGKGIFKAQGRIVLFDGYLKIYSPSDDKDKKDKNQLLPDFEVDDELVLNELLPTQHFTQPPPRYTEASLVRLLEKEEIGRPATYASILSSIQDRGYVTLDARKFHASELGMLVNKKLVEFFPSILGLSFTAEMEANLDKIASGEFEWPTVIGDFYKDFAKDLEKASEEMESEKNKQEGDEVCELCAEPMVARWSKQGKFLGCSGFPKCKNTKSLNPDEQDIGRDLGVKCQKCHNPMILKISRKGKFAGCSSYPDCTTTLPLDKNGEVLQIDLTGQDCEKCGAEMVIRTGRRGPFISCSGFPACRNTKPLPKPEDAEDGEENPTEETTKKEAAEDES